MVKLATSYIVFPIYSGMVQLNWCPISDKVQFPLECLLHEELIFPLFTPKMEQLF